MTHSHTARRRDAALRLVDQTRLILLFGSILVVLAMSCVAFFATMGGMRYAAAVVGYPSLWMLMLAVHLLREPPLVITLPDHPEYQALVERREVTALSPRRRAAAKAALCTLWVAWGGVLYLPLLLSPVIDVAFGAATGALSIHAIICGVLSFRACRACAYSVLISRERLILRLTAHGNLTAVTPASLRIEARGFDGPAIDARAAFSLSLLRMVAATDRGWLSSASQRRMRNQALATISGIRRDSGVHFDLQDLASDRDEASESAPSERGRMFTWFDWELRADIRCGRFARSQAVFRLPSVITAIRPSLDAEHLHAPANVGLH